MTTARPLLRDAGGRPPFAAVRFTLYPQMPAAGAPGEGRILEGRRGEQLAPAFAQQGGGDDGRRGTGGKNVQRQDKGAQAPAAPGRKAEIGVGPESGPGIKAVAVFQQIAAAAAANAQAGDGDGGPSGFLWPCPSSKRITSGFGKRAQPTAGASTNHKGIDIGASYGASIIAAAGGRVTTATYSSSAGNYIVISHGNGLSTVYMHCSALYVSAGQTVSAGQSIAAVGSTGYSTGNHLHFGVIKNGSYVNPLGYVG